MHFYNDSYSGTPNSNWLVSNNEMNLYLQREGSLETSLSGFVNSTIQLISDKFEEYVGRTLIAQNFIGYYDGTGCNKLFTENYPINNIISLQYRNSPIDSWTDFYTGSATANILTYSNHIQLYSNYFPFGKKNIKIVYNAGYTSTPGDIKQCAIEAVKQHYDNSNFKSNRLGLKSSNGGGDASTSQTYEDIWDKHKIVLDSYRSIFI